MKFGPAFIHSDVRVLSKDEARELMSPEMFRAYKRAVEFGGMPAVDVVVSADRRLAKR